ncbi:MAG: glutathione S-transferase family protein [Cyanobacteria bacterium P01_D01_bin.44]
MLTVHGMTFSGNCYKVKLLLEQLQTPYTWQEVDIMTGSTRTDSFLAMNPNGKVPTLEIEPGRYLPESNAILYYLAQGTPFFPAERLAQAEVLRWLFFEQYSHEPYIAVARFVQQMLPADHPRQAELPKLQDKGYAALKVMDQHLAEHPYFVDECYSIADIGLFAYTHVAADGGFDLNPFSAIQAWFERVRSQPHFIPMFS